MCRRLRERPEDLAVLADHILHHLRIPGTATRTLSPEALAHLATYRWPGNVRELRNVIERIVLMSPNSGPITGEEVLQVLPRAASAPSLHDQTQLPLDEIERLHIERVLQSSGGNKTQAAKTLGIDYKTLSAKLKKYAGGG
jgi:transcriptional regulator with PAS, ATPase and Fis domain